MALPISEIDFSGMGKGMHRIVSYEAKWIHGTVAYEGTKGVLPGTTDKETGTSTEGSGASVLPAHRLPRLRAY